MTKVNNYNTQYKHGHYLQIYKDNINTRHCHQRTMSVKRLRSDSFTNNTIPVLHTSVIGNFQGCHVSVTVNSRMRILFTSRKFVVTKFKPSLIVKCLIFIEWKCCTFTFMVWKCPTLKKANTHVYLCSPFLWHKTINHIVGNGWETDLDLIHAASVSTFL